MSDACPFQVAADATALLAAIFHDTERLTVGIWFAGEVVGGELAPGDDLDRAVFFPLATPPEPLAFPTDRRLADLQAGAFDRIPDSTVG